MTVTNFPVLTHRLKLHNHRNIWGKIEAELSVVSTFWLMTREVNLVANNEHLIELQKGVSNWNAWRSQNLRLQIDLKEANLAYAEVSRSDFNEADLSLANLGGANLSLATFRDVTLCMTNLNGANLSLANLCGVNLSLANLSGANLRGAVSRKTDFNGARLKDANLRDTDIQVARLDGAILDKAILSR